MGADDQQLLVYISSPSSLAKQPAMCMLALCFASSLPSGHHAAAEVEVSAISATDLSNLSRSTDGDNKKRKSHGGAKECCAAKDRDPMETIGTILPCLDDMSASRCVAFASRSTYDALSRTHKTLRKLIRSDYIYELRRELGVVEQWIYMFATGDTAWKAFDPKRRMWMSLPPCSTDMAFIMSDKESLSAGTHLLWMGKEITNYAIFRYALSTNSWWRGPLMNQPRCLFASASCGEHAFVAGGNYDGVVLKSVEKYDALQCMWECLPDMNIARQKSSGCYMDGKFYVIGGRDEQHKRLTSGEEYNPQTRNWRMIPDMFPLPAGREIMESSPPLVAVVSNKLYSIDSSINILRMYNKASNTWTILGNLPVRADFHNGWGLAFKALGDELYVIGGYMLPSGDRPLMAMFSWKPEENEGRVPVWNVVTFTRPGAGTFLSNCAVMAC